jgi:hypothetical protein
MLRKSNKNTNKKKKKIENWPETKNPRYRNRVSEIISNSQQSKMGML